MKHVAVGIISKQNKEGKQEYLLVSSAKDFGKYSGYYYPPGGHVEKGEDCEGALAREIKEELGLKVQAANKLAETESDVKDQITHWYKCDIESHDLEINKNEIADAGYFTQQQMKNLKIWPATRRFFATHIFTK